MQKLYINIYIYKYIYPATYAFKAFMCVTIHMQNKLTGLV